MSPEATRNQAERHLTALHGLVTNLVPDDVPLPEAVGLWDVFDGIERSATAAKVLLARKVDESEQWKRAGYRSAAEFMAQRSGVSMTMANAALVTSKRLQDLPATETAIRTGELSLSQAEAISHAAKAAKAAAPEKNLGKAEADLLGMAPRASLSELRQESGRIRLAADPKPEKTYERQRADRYVKSYTSSDGGWVLSGRGTADDGGAFLSTITAILIELYGQHAGSDTPITRDQLVYDALMEALRRARCYANGIDISNDDHPYWNTPSATESDTASDVGADDSGPGGRSASRLPKSAKESGDANHPTPNTSPLCASNSQLCGVAR